MPLALQNIYAPGAKDLTTIVRNHRDGVIGICPPDVHKLEFGGRWLDRGAKCTELNITSTYGRIAIITLEDDGNWGIIVAGNVRNGWNRYDVDSSKDFDVRLTDDGAIELKVRNGNWNPSQGALIRLNIIPFVR